MKNVLIQKTITILLHKIVIQSKMCKDLHTQCLQICNIVFNYLSAYFHYTSFLKIGNDLRTDLRPCFENRLVFLCWYLIVIKISFK